APSHAAVGEVDDGEPAIGTVLYHQAISRCGAGCVDIAELAWPFPARAGAKQDIPCRIEEPDLMPVEHDQATIRKLDGVQHAVLRIELVVRIRPDTSNSEQDVQRINWQGPWRRVR